MKRSMSRSFAAALFAFSLACSHTDQEKARQQADEARQKAKEEAKKLSADAKRTAEDLKSGINRALDKPGTTDSATNQASEKLSNGAHDAGVKLDHAALIAKVKAKLASDVGLNTVSNVSVDANGDVITLHGTVTSEAQKQQAEQAASQVAGVRKVIDGLQVQP